MTEVGEILGRDRETAKLWRVRLQGLWPNSGEFGYEVGYEFRCEFGYKELERV